MSHKFEVGDLATIISTEGGEDLDHVIGKVVTIETPLLTMYNVASKEEAFVHIVSGININPPKPGQFPAFRPEQLKPFYDGNELGTWDEKVWSPKTLEKINA